MMYICNIISFDNLLLTIFSDYYVLAHIPGGATDLGDHEDYVENDHEVHSIQTKTDSGSTSHG